ncbi:MAG TPA: hypothetical protein VGL72_05525 [Bryobacteraceae bacterium]|jgi:hypothetical protein
MIVLSIPVHVRVDGRNFAEVSCLPKFFGVEDLRGGTALVPDLHRALAGASVGGTHALGVIHGEGHGLFLVYVLAGVERCDECSQCRCCGVATITASIFLSSSMWR